MTKTFVKINDEFPCAVCGHFNPPAPRTCRNHCQKCLCSLHVDISPGDRAESCHGILRPISIETVGGEMRSIVFRCEKCGKISKNKIAEDDDREKLLEIFSPKN
ncbi:RNHCP domain-containing protein [bacterium]|jgi:hypothetical protein|nr:RNHCP domain-containing protein [bacterium]MBT6831574.1 RNHCP domain-containing protein [bacterium]MBT6995953.1 RNHCP domain-containing protein [bacterium]MBT7772390.1 RNHCP domain-containing protein [bacterium]